MPSTITYKVQPRNFSTSYYSGEADSGCWTALRANAYVLPENMDGLNSDFNSNALGNSTTYRNVLVEYDSSCELSRSKVDVATALAEKKVTNQAGTYYQNGNCTSVKVQCSLSDPLPKQCRMNVRMVSQIPIQKSHGFLHELQSCELFQAPKNAFHIMWGAGS